MLFSVTYDINDLLDCTQANPRNAHWDIPAFHHIRVCFFDAPWLGLRRSSHGFNSILIAYGISIGTRGMSGSGSWRTVIGVGIIWAAILGIGILFMPES